MEVLWDQQDGDEVMPMSQGDGQNIDKEMPSQGDGMEVLWDQKNGFEVLPVSKGDSKEIPSQLDGKQVLWDQQDGVLPMSQGYSQIVDEEMPSQLDGEEVLWDQQDGDEVLPMSQGDGIWTKFQASWREKKFCGISRMESC